MYHKHRKVVVRARINKKRKLGGNGEMKELAEKFIGKECIIYSFSETQQYTGVIKEVTDGAVLLERNDKTNEAINLDFVMRIREYPKNKKGKKKSIVY